MDVDFPSWLKKAMTPIVIAIASLSIVNQALDFVTNRNFVLITYIFAFLITSAWTFHVFTTKNKSVIDDSLMIYAYQPRTRIVAALAALALPGVIAFHFATNKGAFVIHDASITQAISDLQLLDVAITTDGFDLKLKNSGGDSAVIYELWLLIDNAVFHPTPCEMPLPFSATYSYPFSISLGSSAVNLAGANVKVEFVGEGPAIGLMPTRPTPSSMINHRLLKLLERAERQDALEDIYWALEPLAVSQVVPPKSADRFLVRLVPDGERKLTADSCRGGLHYTSRLVVVYDKNKVIVSDPIEFTLAGWR